MIGEIIALVAALLIATNVVVMWRLIDQRRRMRMRLRNARDLLLRYRDLVLIHAGPGAFRNGVTNGHADEGEYWMSHLVDDADGWIEEYHETREDAQ